MTQRARILGVGQFEAPAGRIPYLFLPDRGLFARRAERLHRLADGHALGEYLALLAKLAAAQQEVLDRFPAVPLPGAREQALCSENHMPLLAANSWRRDSAWREGLHLILRRMQQETLPSAAQQTITGLTQAPAALLELVADKILAGDLGEVVPGELPFVAAALQVYWLHMALELGEQTFARSEEVGVCPVCGSYPTAGVVRSGGTENGLRYLCCSLCSTQWHLVRLKCSSCETTEGIDYYLLEGLDSAIKAESCSACGTYLKLLYLEKDTRMEALADDLASLSLDILLAAKGCMRGGPNLFLHPGEVS